MADTVEGLLWICGRGSEPVALEGLITDITEYKQAQRELFEANQRLAAHLDNSPLAVVEFDPAFRIVRWSDAAERLFGWTADELLGRPLTELRWVHEDDVEGTDRVMADMQAGRRPRNVHVNRNYCKDRTVVLCEWYNSALYDAQGRLTSILSQVLDITQRERAERELRERIARSELIAAGTCDAIWEWDVPNHRVIFSPRWKELRGFGLDEVGDREEEWKSGIHPEDAPRVMAAVQAHFEGKSAFFAEEYRIRCKDGSWKWVLDRGIARRDATGRVVRMAGSESDITERKRADEELSRARRLAEQRAADLQAVLQAVPAAVWIAHDAECRSITGNRTANEWLRLPEGAEASLTAREGVRPTHFKVCQDGRDLRSEELPVQRAAHGIEIRGFEQEIVFADGIVRPMLGNATPLWDEEGRPRGAVAAFVDITARKQAEQALRDSQADLTRAQAVGHIGSWRLNTQSNELTWSAENHRIFGIAEGTPLTYETFLATVHPDDREYVNRMWQGGLRGEPYDIEHRLIVDGKVKWVRERAEIEFDQDNRLLGGFGTTQEITELKMAEEALREADRRKDEFLAILAHELRNPLAPIRNAVEILKLTGIADPIARAARDMIERQLGHMVRLVDDLMDVSRITRGRLALRRERIELAVVLEQAIEASRHHVQCAGHELSWGPLPEPIYLDADPVRLEQVFLNLLTNACKYTKKGGRILLTTERDGMDVVVKVADTGIGISPEHLPHVFDLFAQGGTGAEQTQGGLGIGLSLVRGLVAMHGGSVEARSDGPGKGSEFLVRLPTLAEQPAAQPPASEERGNLMQAPARRILVADDNTDVVESLAMLLRVTGHEVEIAHDGLEAVELAARFRPDVVLLDIGMPGLDGYAACRRIRQHPWGKNMVIVALTGWSQDGDRGKAEEVGFNGHLVKPVEPSALLRVLNGARAM